MSPLLCGFTTSTSQQTVGNGSGATFGYTFTLAAPVRVTQLGFWDFGANGLSAAVPVTLWNSAGTALASATVPAGTTAGELNQYLFVALAAPVTLAAGTYTLDGYVSNSRDVSQSGVATITGAAGITYGAPRAVGGSDAFPTTNDAGGTNGYFGPNFQFVAVPEPGTWALLAAGAAGLGLALRRRRAAAR